MLGFTEAVFLILIVTEFILGNLVNGFIGLVNGSHWFKNKKISLFDFIITSLALFRIILLWIIFIDGLIIVFSYHTHDSGIVMQLIDVLWTFTNHFSLWLFSCLGVFYCLKIANFSYPTFLWLKWRASRVVVGMLLGALLLSCVCTISLMNEFKIYSVLSRFLPATKIARIIGVVITISYLVGDSFILILCNNKLKQTVVILSRLWSLEAWI
ncbi:Taste receptor type 2 member 3 [Lemmus lemmus]